MIYQLKRNIEIPVDINEAWEFFSNPANLKVLTPSFLNMNITSNVPEEIYPGLIITYNVHPFLSLPVNWVTEITHVNKPLFFVDEQRHGPYKMWHHQHHFRETSSGTIVEDVVDYIMPYGLLGRIPHYFFVEKKLNEIFDYRSEVLKDRFGSRQDLLSKKHPKEQIYKGLNNGAPSEHN